MRSDASQLTNRCPIAFSPPPRPRPQEDVPGAEGQRQRSGSQRHVLGAAGFRGRRQQPLEVRERGVGARRQAGAAEPELRVHPPGLAQLRGALDESARVLQQSQALQQTQRRRTGEGDMTDIFYYLFIFKKKHTFFFENNVLCFIGIQRQTLHRKRWDLSFGAMTVYSPLFQKRNNLRGCKSLDISYWR